VKESPVKEGPVKEGPEKDNPDGLLILLVSGDLIRWCGFLSKTGFFAGLPAIVSLILLLLVIYMIEIALYI
jgi:hypothetical protein